MMSLTITEAEKKNKQKLVICELVLCLVHVIWTERQMLKLVLNVKYLLLLSFLTAAGGTFKVL